jgi:hypothetical protein
MNARAQQPELRNMRSIIQKTCILRISPPRGSGRSDEVQLMSAPSVSNGFRKETMRSHSATKTLLVSDGDEPASTEPHRFIFSGTWSLPSPSAGFQRAVLGGWNLDGVITIQFGTALTIAKTNATNVFGISEDRAQLSGTCSKSQLVKGGTCSPN